MSTLVVPSALYPRLSVYLVRSGDTTFHFLNVIKDLEWDRTQLVMGLPQRVGKRWSIVAAGLCVAVSLLLAAV